MLNILPRRYACVPIIKHFVIQNKLQFIFYKVDNLNLN